MWYICLGFVVLDVVSHCERAVCCFVCQIAPCHHYAFNSTTDEARNFIDPVENTIVGFVTASSWSSDETQARDEGSFRNLIS